MANEADDKKLPENERKSVFSEACADIRENLWILNDTARSRITGWFLAIAQDAYDRGKRDAAKAVSAASAVSECAMVTELQQVRAAFRAQMQRLAPGLKEAEIDALLDHTKDIKQ